MNAIEHGHGSSSPIGNAPDITNRANLVIWSYFFAFGIALYISISGISLYFRYVTEREEFAKIGSVPSQELADQRAEELEILSGKRATVDGKKAISIDDAMNKVLQVTR
jgi:hypothetical protein